MKIEKAEILRHMVFATAVFVAAIMMYGPLTNLFESKMYRNYHDLIPFIPLISAYLLYLKIKNIRENMQFSFGLGGVVIISGIILYSAGYTLGSSFNENNFASATVASALVMFWGAFILVYGTKAFLTVLFPHLFLVFVIPIPYDLMEEIIVFLQKGSTEFANLLFWISHAPYYREGFLFHLPSISVEVAPECSGIRSGLALFITCLLAGYMFLNSWWRRLILVLIAIPMTMFKNGIRITTLTLLGTYVDPRILQSSLHREGGIPFFIVALFLMAPILYFLRKSENTGSRIKTQDQGSRIKT